MSYSNDWSISGITGLTSLKDCYQWDGEKRLEAQASQSIQDIGRKRYSIQVLCE